MDDISDSDLSDGEVEAIAAQQNQVNAKKRKLDSFLTRGEPVEQEYVRRDFKPRANRQTELQTTIDVLKAEVDAANTTNRQIARKIQDTFQNPTAANYLDALLLLTQLWPGSDIPVQSYIAVQAEDSW